MKSIILSGVTACSLVFSLASLNAQDFSKSSKEFNRRFQKVETAKEIEELPKEAQLAMVCSKCKSVTILIKKELATKPGHGTTEESLTVDQCPGCGGKITTKPGGKETAMIHTCSKCGDESAFCCATKPGEKTPGM